MYRSEDLRKAAVAYCYSGHTYEDTAAVFGVSRSSIGVWVKKYRETGNLKNKPLNRGFKKIDPVKLAEYVKEHPDETQREMAEAFGCCNESISKALRRNHITRKKKTRRYKEQDPQKVAEYQEKIRDIPPESMEYVDESGFDSYYDREYGYAPRGEKVMGSVCGRKFQRSNLVAAKMGKELIAPFQYTGTTDAGLFEGWFEHQLLPALPANAVIIMDNASFHRKDKLFELIENRPVRLIFLPPYSPELNPIEKVWANLKRWLRKNMRDYSSFDDAISAAIESIFQVG